MATATVSVCGNSRCRKEYNPMALTPLYREEGLCGPCILELIDEFAVAGAIADSREEMNRAE